MKPVAALFLTLIWLIISGGRPLVGAAQKETRSDWEKKIVCNDYDEFYINEQQTVQTGNFTIPNGDLIVVEKRYLRLTLYRDGNVLKQYTVAIGKPETPTPVGEWKIINKGGKWGGGFGARWMGINCPWGIYGIHGTNKPDSIGRKSSHGCIRMHNRNVIELYNLVQVGTPVHIIGELPKVVFRKNYRRGSVGEDVLRLQFALRDLGFNPGPADARFGDGMEQAVCKLQQFYGLSVTGNITPNEQFILGVESKPKK